MMTVQCFSHSGCLIKEFKATVQSPITFCLDYQSYRNSTLIKYRKVDIRIPGMISSYSATVICFDFVQNLLSHIDNLNAQPRCHARSCDHSIVFCSLIHYLTDELISSTQVKVFWFIFTFQAWVGDSRFPLPNHNNCANPVTVVVTAPHQTRRHRR